MMLTCGGGLVVVVWWRCGWVVVSRRQARQGALYLRGRRMDAGVGVKVNRVVGGGTAGGARRTNQIGRQTRSEWRKVGRTRLVGNDLTAD